MVEEMTPEEHVAKAEQLLEVLDDPERFAEISQDLVVISRAQVHMLIANHKKKYPPKSGRPLRSSGRMHSHANTFACIPACPAYGTDSTNYPRPLPDRPQA